MRRGPRLPPGGKGIGLTDALRQQLLNTKLLSPRPADAGDVLRRIMRLDITNFNEAEVRAEMIEPLIRLLGYDKESAFSLSRERKVRVLGSGKAIDFSMTLFEADFWVIEAKRPMRPPSFGEKDVYQALRYAAHPDINAALLMLFDGNKIEVFDREVDLTAPVLRIARADLDRDFDELRMLLSPWQAYFFEKRRVLRLIDKVFDQEVHLARLEEMRDAIDRRLVDKQVRVFENNRSRIDPGRGLEEYVAHLRSADPAEVVEVSFFGSQTRGAVDAMAEGLVERCRDPCDADAIVGRIFPEQPRAANSAFWVHSMAFLLAADLAGLGRLALPAYLAGRHGDAAAGLRALIPLCLTAFHRERIQHVILLQASASRRLAKLLMLTQPEARDNGMLLHLRQRVAGSELSFEQGVSSPERHLLLSLDAGELRATSTFVRKHADGRGGFQLDAAEQALRDTWAEEARILGGVGDFRRLLFARDMDEFNASDASEVVHDSLGHDALRMLEGWPMWKQWVLDRHRPLVAELQRLGSWQARSWIGINFEHAEEPELEDQILADRFFLGDLGAATGLRRGYGWPEPRQRPPAGASPSAP